MNKLPSKEKLHQLFKYCPVTGKLSYKESVCNRIKVGEIVKRRSIMIEGVNYLVHRIVYKMEHKAFNELMCIDHINGDPNDNSLNNLRLVTKLDNNKNKATPSHNTSGHIGVGWRKDKNKWNSHIGVNKKRIHLGYFCSINEAIKARRKAQLEYNFHTNHGR